MADIPQISQAVHLPVDIAVHSHLLDHCFEAKPVLPAVEAMLILAQAVHAYRPQVDITAITKARFEKFLFIPPGAASIHALCILDVFDNGAVYAVLQTKSRAGKTSITRRKEHVSLCFSPVRPMIHDFSPDAIEELEGLRREIVPGQIYRELVPFGPAYHNISENLQLAQNGAIATIRAPSYGAHAALSGSLGSPFVLDAALHAACVWGQRYAGVVAFPVGIDKRLVFNRTQPGESYISRILPVRTDPELLVFDIWIYDRRGCTFEAVKGVRMRDVSGGRLKPPLWIVSGGKDR